MDRYVFKYKKLNKILVGAALMFLGACATVPAPPPPKPLVTIALQDVTVWIDAMPNADHRGYATYTLKLTNISDSTINVTGIEGFLAHEKGGPAFRRFAVTAEEEGKTITSIELQPGLTHEYRFKAGAGYVPFDSQRYEKVTAGITMTFSAGPSATAEQTPVPVMITH